MTPLVWEWFRIDLDCFELLMLLPKVRVKIKPEG